MSGFIKNASDSVRDVKEINRWVQVLEADDVLGLPAIEFQVKYVNDALLIRLSKPYANKNEKSVDLNKEKKFRNQYLQACVQDWRGVNNQNVRRLSDFFLTHDEIFEGGDERADWEFSKTDVGFIGEHISTELFGNVVAETTNLNEFVRMQLEREKKD